jgi:hypothetical protein
MLSLKFTSIRFCQIDSILISIDPRDRDESHLDQVCQCIEEAEDGHDDLALTWADMMNDLKRGVAQNLPLSSSSSEEENMHQFINQWLYDLCPYLPSKSIKNIVHVPTLSQQLLLEICYGRT